MRPQLTYYDLGSKVTAFSTTRHGGFSTGNYGELNVNAFCGDNPESIAKNRRLLCEVLGLSGPERLLIPHQVHGIVLSNIGDEFVELSTDMQQHLLEGLDALMTDAKEVCIGVSTADCVPIIIYSPNRHCAAVVHAGWRGTLQRIAANVASAMNHAFKVDYTDMQVVIGPCISLKNFEVGDDVFDDFNQSFLYMDQVACRLPSNKPNARGVRPDRWHIDLPLCNRFQLQELGILSGNIRDVGICTYDHTNDYFSARRLGICSGRIYTGIVLH